VDYGGVPKLISDDTTCAKSGGGGEKIARRWDSVTEGYLIERPLEVTKRKSA
jgi:hypothetical protein